MTDPLRGATAHAGHRDEAPPELTDLLRFAGEHLHLDLLVIADDGSPGGEWHPVASSFGTVGGRRSWGTGEIGTVVRLPLTTKDGTTFGQLCGFSQHPDQTLGQRDVAAMRPFTASLVDVILALRADWTHPAAARTALGHLDEAGGPAAWFQPAFHLTTAAVTGYEALARFPAQSPPPDSWFAAADLTGRRLQLELSSIRAALSHLDHLDGWLSLNVSEPTLLAPAFRELVDPVPAGRLVLELTEQHCIADYLPVREVLADLRRGGALLAIDDVGSGFSSLRHILSLSPEIIKLDIGLVHDIDDNRQQQALVRSLNEFAGEAGMYLVAEGVETASELTTLIDLGIEYGQGFHLGVPAPCPGHVSSLAPSPELDAS